MARVRPALVVWLLALLVLVASGWVLLPFPRRPTGFEEILWTIGFGFGYATVGAVLVDRRPHEPVARLTLAIGLAVVASVGLRAVAVFLEAQPGSMPPARVLAAMGSQLLQTIALFAAGGVLLVRFPSGAGRDVLTRTVDGLFAVTILLTFLQALKAGPIDFPQMAAIDNPIGVIDEETAAWLSFVDLAAYALSIGLAVVVLVRRYRRSGQVARAQIRWVAAAGLIQIALFPLIFAVDWLWTVWFLSSVLLPLAIGVAILRYRLFDIDRIVSRTLAYAVVTALLATVFVVTNLALQAVVASASGENTLAVAGSTLLVASLFQPVRRRIQVPIDRRFNRAHLDAERVIAAFVRETRDEVDLQRLRGAVVRTVDEAVRPARAGLWLRGSGT